MEKKNHTSTIDELLDCSFLVIDKPLGPSTHEVTSYIRKLLGVKKVGQMGTLDPQASGVLVVGIGKAVRLLRFVDMREKTYVGVLRLRKTPLDIVVLQAEFDTQVGKITQTPPKHSAVAKRPRQRKVYEFKARDIISNTALFESRVEAGTYIRVLCQEVGKRFGEGKMIELRRTSVASIDDSQANRLPDLVDAVWKFRERGDASALQKMLLPAHEMLHLPALCVADSVVDAFARGSPLAISDVGGAEADSLTGGWTQIVDKQGHLVAIAQYGDGEIHPRVVLAKIEGEKKLD